MKVRKKKKSRKRRDRLARFWDIDSDLGKSSNEFCFSSKCNFTMDE